MAIHFCSSCRHGIPDTIMKCPKCGGAEFFYQSSAVKSSDSTQTNPEEDRVLESQQVASVQVSETKRSWDWLWQTIGIVIIIKLFGPAGGIAAVLVYLWQQPKIGKWRAAALSVGIGIAVPLLILAMIR